MGSPPQSTLLFPKPLAQKHLSTKNKLETDCTPLWLSYSLKDLGQLSCLEVRNALTRGPWRGQTPPLPKSSSQLNTSLWGSLLWGPWQQQFRKPTPSLLRLSPRGAGEGPMFRSQIHCQLQGAWAAVLPLFIRRSTVSVFIFFQAGPTHPTDWGLPLAEWFMVKNTGFSWLRKRSLGGV